MIVYKIHVNRRPFGEFSFPLVVSLATWFESMLNLLDRPRANSALEDERLLGLYTLEPK